MTAQTPVPFNPPAPDGTIRPPWTPVTRTIGIVAQVMLLINAAMLAAESVLQVGIRADYDSARFDELLDKADTLDSLARWASVLLPLCTAVPFLIWLWRLWHCDRADDRPQGRHPRVLLWLGWLVPVLNWVYPALVMRDLWNSVHTARQARLGRLDDVRRGLSPLPLVWTLMWGLGSTLSVIANFRVRDAVRQESMSSLADATVLHAGAAAMLVVAALAMIAIIQRLNATATSA